MILIGIKKEVFSVEDIFTLVYGKIIRVRDSKGNQRSQWSVNQFWRIPVSYRKELVKKTCSKQLRRYAYCMTEVRINGFRWSNSVDKTDIERREHIIDELTLWLKWGVEFDEPEEMLNALQELAWTLSLMPNAGMNNDLDRLLEKTDELIKQLAEKSENPSQFYPTSEWLDKVAMVI